MIFAKPKTSIGSSFTQILALCKTRTQLLLLILKFIVLPVAYNGILTTNGYISIHILGLPVSVSIPSGLVPSVSTLLVLVILVSLICHHPTTSPSTSICKSIVPNRLFCPVIST